MSDLEVEGFVCLTTLKYAGETHCDFVNCFTDGEGKQYLMIFLGPYPTFSSNVLEYYPKNQNSIRPCDHPEYQFVCDEVVDLDDIEANRSEEDEL